MYPYTVRFLYYNVTCHYSSSGVCGILFTDKFDTSPTTKALAYQVRIITDIYIPDIYSRVRLSYQYSHCCLCCSALIQADKCVLTMVMQHSERYTAAARSDLLYVGMHL
jgi:hypothetical protein